jgi:serine/threonine-protein kinase HipA
MNGELVGCWTIKSQGQHEFRYEEQWLAAKGARPISISMPLQPTDAPYKGQIVENYFENLLPDSTDIRRRIQTRFGVASSSAFDLLSEIGRDCVGAIQLLPAGHECSAIDRIEGAPLSDEAVANVLRSVVASPIAGQIHTDEFRISLAGAQEKTALLLHEGAWHRPIGTTPTTHILKLPLGRVGNMQADFSTSVENEWLCAQIVREFGLPVADCEIASFEDQKVLVVKRFDRKLHSRGRWWLRIPQEDMCQATATPPAQRYESDGGPGITEISSLLLGSRSSETDRRNFFRAQVLFWMLCATDGHAKNFSLFIEPHGRFSLTPFYDILSAHPILGKGKNQLAPQKARMAMAVTGKNRHNKWTEIQPRHWTSTARSIGLESSALEDIARLVGDTPAVIANVVKLVPTGFPKKVLEPILDGLEKSTKRLAGLG